MDSSSISLPIPGTKKDWRIDVPMRSFQGGESARNVGRIWSSNPGLVGAGYYPQLIAMYKRLGVTFCERDFSYSFSRLTPSAKPRHRRITTTMIYNGASGRAGVSMPSIVDGVYAESKHLSSRWVAWFATLVLFAVFTLQITLNYVRLLFLSVPSWRPKDIESMTFRQWAEASVPTGYLARLSGWDVAWQDFTWNVLVPLFSAVCTTSEEDVLEHPAEEMLGADEARAIDDWLTVALPG